MSEVLEKKFGGSTPSSPNSLIQFDAGDAGMSQFPAASVTVSAGMRLSTSLVCTLGQLYAEQQYFFHPDAVENVDPTAGYGSRTRFTALGRLGTTGIPIPRKKNLTR